MAISPSAEKEKPLRDPNEELSFPGLVGFCRVGIFCRSKLNVLLVCLPEEYERDSEKPKKVRASQREIKHKKSKNSKEER